MEPLTFTIRRAEPADFAEIAAFIVAQSASPETQCIQSATGETVRSLLEEMEKWHASGEMTWMIALSGEMLTGLMGAEFDREMGRAWLRGPFALDNFPSLSRALWDPLRAALPGVINRYDSFLNAENARGQAFYTTAGFTEKGRAHVYTAKREDFARIERARIPVQPVQPLCAALQSSFAAVHDDIFSGTFYMGTQIIEKLDSEHRVWVYAPAGEVLGYLYGVIEPWAEEGYIEFLGVSEMARGRGVGGALLLTAMDWFFSERGLPGAGLTVDDGNANARSLYERVGFRLKYTGVNQRYSPNKEA